VGGGGGQIAVVLAVVNGVQLTVERCVCSQVPTRSEKGGTEAVRLPEPAGGPQQEDLDLGKSLVGIARAHVSPTACQSRANCSHDVCQRLASVQRTRKFHWPAWSWSVRYTQ